MEDMLNSKEPWRDLLEIALDAKATDPVVKKVSAQCSWGDYILVLTAGSQVHMRGIYGRLVDYVKNQDELMQHHHSGIKDENRWILMDLGSIIVHIMTKDAREFYNLEDVWFESPVLYREEDQSSSSSSSSS